MFYGEYRGRNHGRMLCFLFKMNSMDYEHFAIGGDSETGIGKICYGSNYNRETKKYSDGPLVATYSWIGDTDIPLLKFETKYIERYESRYFEAMTYIIDYEAKYGKGLWSQCQYEEDEKNKKEEYTRKFRENLMKAFETKLEK
jgi:hypothetical protein